MTERLHLGAPGIYELPPEPIRALTGERMDICAFVGVAPRGPALVPTFFADWASAPCAPGQLVKRTVPVAVESWSQYERVFGGFEGPGLLPYAVASFFENGGRRAWVARIVNGAASGVASGAVQGLLLRGGGALTLRARNPGSWGNSLSASLRFTTRTLLFEAGGATLRTLRLPRDTELPEGTLLRLTLDGGGKLMRFVSSVTREWHPERGEVVLRAQLELPLPRLPAHAEVVEAVLEVADHDERRRGEPRTERLERLGLSAVHPRALGRVLVEESSLLHPEQAWLDSDVAVPVELGAFTTAAFTGGLDRYAQVTPEDFFSDWVPGDECPGDGVHALVDVGEVALVCAPDLYSPRPLVEQANVLDPVSVAGPDFAPCVPVATPLQQAEPVEGLDGLRLDPLTDFDAIVALQQRLVELAEQLQSFVVLLDVPPGLNHRRLLRWRASFGSAYAAAYHPWLLSTRTDDARDALIRVTPSAVAAGIIARKELAFGLPHGPANELCAGVVDVAEAVSPERHDELHPLGVNVYLLERDGARLTAARTLSLDPQWRQLSVRRLVTMLRRVLDRQMQWAVFEPNTRKLRSDIAGTLTTFLRSLHRAGAFRGAAEDEAFFVRCDEELNPPRVVDLGQLICQVGVAPAEPIEFIVLTIVREGDGTLRVGG